MKPGEDGATGVAAAAEQDNELLLEFVQEGEEQLDRAEAALLGFEKRPKPNGEVDAVLRSLHSLKGAAGYVSLFDIQDLCHASEDLLGKGAALLPMPEGRRIDLVFEAITLMRQRLEGIRDCCNTGRVIAPDARVAEFLGSIAGSTQ